MCELLFNLYVVLIILQCYSSQAKAEAQSHTEAAKIEGETAMEQAKLKAEASKIEAVSSNLNNQLYSI